MLEETSGVLRQKMAEEARLLEEEQRKKEEVIKQKMEAYKARHSAKKEAISNFQICGTGRGMRKPGERFQTAAHLRCGHCNAHVCGAGCWQLLHGLHQLLHGYYDKSPGMGEVLPARVPKVHTDDEGEGEE